MNLDRTVDHPVAIFDVQSSPPPGQSGDILAKTPDLPPAGHQLSFHDTVMTPQKPRRCSFVRVAPRRSRLTCHPSATLLDDVPRRHHCPGDEIRRLDRSHRLRIGRLLRRELRYHIYIYIYIYTKKHILDTYMVSPIYIPYIDIGN